MSETTDPLAPATLRELAGMGVAVTGKYLRQVADALEQAIAHDRQPYPTADAYEAACKALHEATAARDDYRRLSGVYETERNDALLRLEAAEKETEAAKQAWRDDREETKRERNDALRRLSTTLETVARVARYMKGIEVWEHGIMSNDHSETPAKVIQSILVERQET